MLKKLNIYKYKAKNRIQIKFVYFYQNFIKNLFIHERFEKIFFTLRKHLYKKPSINSYQNFVNYFQSLIFG